jgi:hypothetical protein
MPDTLYLDQRIRDLESHVRERTGALEIQLDRLEDRIIRLETVVSSLDDTRVNQEIRLDRLGHAIGGFVPTPLRSGRGNVTVETVILESSDGLRGFHKIVSDATRPRLDVVATAPKNRRYVWNGEVCSESRRRIFEEAL